MHLETFIFLNLKMIIKVLKNYEKHFLIVMMYTKIKQNVNLKYIVL
jgi:hypothetical protein